MLDLVSSASASSTALLIALNTPLPVNGLSCWIRGSCGGVSAGLGWAVAASVEEAQGDEVVGGSEPVGDAGEQPQLRIDALGQPVRQAVGDGGDDPGTVLLDPVVELDEGGDAASAGPFEPGVEHGDGLRPAVLEHVPKLFLQQVGTVEPVVE